MESKINKFHVKDQRRMDLHFSTSFLKLLMGRGKAGTCELASRLEDFTEIYPERGKFFLLCLKYLKCAKNNASTLEEREQLEVEYFSSKLSDLCLTMEFPSVTTVNSANDLFTSLIADNFISINSHT